MTRLRRLILVRHGETVGQSSIRYHGATDVALNQHGKEQMHRVRAALAGEEVDAVYTSRLQRTTTAARIIAPEAASQAVAGFDEIHFGRWEGLTREEIVARDEELFHVWQSAGEDFVYPDGESLSDFRARVVSSFMEIAPAAPERVLIVAHKGVIRTITTELLRLSPEESAAWQIDLGSVHVLSMNAAAWSAEAVNDTRHLCGR
jgi:broad specificity phosphatase PhoE